jgi:hypothetical protein
MNLHLSDFSRAGCVNLSFLVDKYKLLVKVVNNPRQINSTLPFYCSSFPLSKCSLVDVVKVTQLGDFGPFSEELVICESFFNKSTEQAGAELCQAQ